MDLLVAGLGNPGPEHARDRHNVGWMVVDELARRHEGSFKGKFRGRLADVRVGDAKLALLKPETYMNESGASIQAAAAFYKLPPEQVLVVHDDVDLESARLQARLGGGLAGHNGLRSIAQRLGSQDFLRLRVGVGRPGRGDPRPVADYVLSPFAPEDDAEAIVDRACDAVEMLAAKGSTRPSAASTEAISARGARATARGAPAVPPRMAGAARAAPSRRRRRLDRASMPLCPLRAWLSPETTSARRRWHRRHES